MSSLIQVQDLGFEFEGKTLLSGIHLEVQRGESVVLIGPSGEGKSVLLKAMAGILEPTAGQVLVENKNLYTATFTERTQIMRRMGMLFQKNALFDSLSCGENIAFPLREAAQYTEAEIQSKVDFFLNEVGISHAKELFPDEISGGMQKRLGIARALALNPEVIFYDDPTAGLDPITSRKIIDVIVRLQKEKGSTLVAITNDMNRAYQLAGRIGMVVDGGLIVTGTEQETKAHRDPRVHQFITGDLNGPLTAVG